MVQIQTPEFWASSALTCPIAKSLEIPKFVSNLPPIFLEELSPQVPSLSLFLSLNLGRIFELLNCHFTSLAHYLAFLTFITCANMSRHHPDLVMCRKQAGISLGRLCDKCDGKCPVCDSYVRPTTLVRICDECSFGNYQNKCIVCGGEGISDAFYCFECTRLEKDRDGCPKIINLGSSRTDLYVQPYPFMKMLAFSNSL
jgi:PHD finger-like domain-containing protein 5A